MSATLRPTRGPQLRLSELIDRADGHLTLDSGDARPGTGASTLVSGVGLDSRTVRAHDLYAALPGANVHGAAFAAQALAAGAVAILTDLEGRDLVRSVSTQVPVLLADDPRAVLGDVAAQVYGRPADAMTMIGITGTNGKTTTTYLAEGALRAAGHATGLIGTVETRIGDERVPSVRTTPEACDLHGLLAVMRERDALTCVMEVSSHALALHRVDGLVFDVAVFTNLSQDHLDFHGSMEAYFEAKASLFTPERSRVGVVCVDDEWGSRLAAEARIPVVTFSSRADALADWRLGRRDLDVMGEQIAETVELLGPDGARLQLPVALPGEHNRIDAALAAIALVAAGLSQDDVVQAMSVGARVPGRMELIDLGTVAPRVYVDFAHTPDAITATLSSLRARGGTSPVVVLGAGGDRDRGKRPAMGAAAARESAVVVVTDDNPRHERPESIRAAVLEGVHAVIATAKASGSVVAYREIPDRREAIAYALRAAGPDGVVAVLGKGHEQGQTVGDEVLPFDDRDEVRAAFKRVSAEGVDR